MLLNYFEIKHWPWLFNLYNMLCINFLKKASLTHSFVFSQFVLWYQINKSITLLAYVITDLASHFCQWWTIWLSQICISSTPAVSIASLHLSTVSYLRHKCFLFEDFQTKSIPERVLAKTESRFPSLWPFIIPPAEAIKAWAPAQQSDRQTKSSLGIWRIDPLSPHWLYCASAQTKCEHSHLK